MPHKKMLVNVKPPPKKVTVPGPEVRPSDEMPFKPMTSLEDTPPPNPPTKDTKQLRESASGKEGWRNWELRGDREVAPTVIEEDKRKQRLLPYMAPMRHYKGRMQLLKKLKH